MYVSTTRQHSELPRYTASSPNLKWAGINATSRCAPIEFSTRQLQRQSSVPPAVWPDISTAWPRTQATNYSRSCELSICLTPGETVRTCPYDQQACRTLRPVTRALATWPASSRTAYGIGEKAGRRRSRSAQCPSARSTIFLACSNMALCLEGSIDSGVYGNAKARCQEHRSPLSSQYHASA